jgi:hypothetical protein
MLSSLVIVAVAALSATAGGQAAGDTTALLGQVRVPVAVLANGQSLPAGTYELRLASGAPIPNAGQSSDAQRWVEFVSGGTVVAGRDVAEILRDADLPPEGASTQSGPPGIRVDLLKGGEFVRVSVKRDGTRYLIYLAVAR